MSRYVLCFAMDWLLMGVWYIQVGDIITEGAEVAVVEAMKMQNVLRAHQAGKVKAVHVKEGSSVTANEVMVEMDDVVVAPAAAAAAPASAAKK